MIDYLIYYNNYLSISTTVVDSFPGTVITSTSRGVVRSVFFIVVIIVVVVILLVVIADVIPALIVVDIPAVLTVVDIVPLLGIVGNSVNMATQS